MNRTVRAMRWFAFCVALAAAASAGWTATSVFDFNPVPLHNGNVGADTETVTVNGRSLIVTGYTSLNAEYALYWKNGGGDEVGLGFVSSDADHELSLDSDGDAIANYMQIDASAFLNSDTWASIRMGSVTLNSPGDQESYDVLGTNTAGDFSSGTALITASTADGTYVPLPDWGQYKYYLVAVHPGTIGTHIGDNILLDSLEVTPEPASLPIILSGLCLGAWHFRRRKR